MIYPYDVKVDGVWYNAGEEIPSPVIPFSEEEEPSEIEIKEETVKKKAGRPRKSEG